MSEENAPSHLSTLSPARNFTIPLAERVRALGGPPAYALRRRRAEDLEGMLLGELRALALKAGAEAAIAAVGRTARLRRWFEELVRTVEKHNLYYPIEANLPIDPDTGGLLDHGEPWRPLPLPTLEGLVARATAPAAR